MLTLTMRKAVQFDAGGCGSAAHQRFDLVGLHRHAAADQLAAGGGDDR
ncbi:MAG: hypothetical protein ACI83N_002124, partial [Hydrogenophaga sp.]